MNAIISAAAGYKPEDLDLFLNSATKNCRNLKIFMIIFAKDFNKFSERFKGLSAVEWICLPPKFSKGTKFYYVPLASLISKTKYPPSNKLIEVLGRFPFHIALERYFFALDILKKQRNCFENILLSDSRDVVIQKDPFAKSESELICGIEKKALGNCRFNADWINHIYGKQAVREMADWQVVCSGVSLGPVNQIEAYLNQMCNEMWQYVPKLLHRGWYDQGIHNRIIFEKKVKFRFADNQGDIIATLGYEDANNITTDSKSNAVCVNGVYPAIVHQYDRFPLLVDFFKKIYKCPKSG
ncbi:MAG: hypothetical protein KKD05_04845 [Candidatus Omnitrophica bacterium]|nr:hypothetical protein [Candidatus Omnitrophota bacterium]